MAAKIEKQWEGKNKKKTEDGTRQSSGRKLQRRENMKTGGKMLGKGGSEDEPTAHRRKSRVQGTRSAHAKKKKNRKEETAKKAQSLTTAKPSGRKKKIQGKKNRGERGKKNSKNRCIRKKK